MRTEIATNPEIAEFWQRVASGEPLSATDASRVRAAAEIVVLKIHWEYGQYIDGNLALSELPVSAYRSAFRGGEGPWLSGLHDAWRALKGQLRPDFVAWIEEEVIK
jgi:hypothetical protein